MKIAVLITYILMITVNALANILPIGGITTGQISDLYADLFAPAPITFSIWGLIYLLLAGYILYQFGLFQKKKEKAREGMFTKIAPYFIASSIANTLWILAWHNKLIFLSLLLMLVILYCLIKIIDTFKQRKSDLNEKIFLITPFTIYFGWITVATIANVTTFLVSIRWYGFGLPQETWTVIILIIGALIGILRMLKDKNIIYGIVFLWAYFGILIKHISPDGFDSEYTAVIITATITMVMFIITKVYIYLRYNRG